MAEIEFEEMREEHLDNVLKIYNYYVINSTATFHMHELSKDEMRSLVFFSDPKYTAFAIMRSGEVCGYAILAQHKTREAYGGTADVTIYLKPGETGKGIGGRAVGFIEELARERGFHALIAGICAENGPSIALFKKCGFEKCAHYREVGKKFGRLLDTVAYEKIIS